MTTLAGRRFIWPVCCGTLPTCETARTATGPSAEAAVHIFRFAENRIVELWDIGQAVPDTPVNHGVMF